jgi:hypothetical protein
LPSFQVTTPNARVNLRPDGTLEVPYSVTNVSGGARRAAFSVKTSDAQTQRWYSIRGAPSLEFSPGTTQQVTVVVTPASGAPAKDYSFSLIAALADNPDVDFSEGPAVTYTVHEKGDFHFPWWILLAALAIVIIVAAIFLIARHLNKTTVKTMPDLTGMSLSDAQNKFSNLAIADANCPVYGPQHTVGLIEKQSQAPNTPLTANPTNVSVCIGVQGVQVPHLPSTSPVDANNVITAASLIPIPLPPPPTPCGPASSWVVVDLSPGQGSWVEAGTSVREIGGCRIRFHRPPFETHHAPLPAHT